VNVGRFAPSPSGSLHLGSLRTALVAWCAARSAGGSFLVRMEDLTTGAAPVREREQLDDLATLGIDHDGPVVRQSERAALYDAAISRLERQGLTYPCYCSRREVAEAAAAPHGPPVGSYPGTCRALDADSRREKESAGRRPATRLRASGRVASFHDRLAGDHRGTVDDFVLRRADGVAAYNLAVVVDDAQQGITQVVRGDDLLHTTPRQVLLQELLGFPTPEYLHVPLVLGPDGERLAKRHGAVGLSDRLAAGETAGRVVGMLAFSLGLASAGEELQAATVLHRFDVDRLPRRPWVLDPPVLRATS
jgi:glutamyl-tRNA synthetase